MTFIGRRPLLTEVRQRLGDTRVVTLTGPGGIGKSRVAWRVMDEERGSHRDGGSYADLAPLPAAELTLPTVARALGLHAEDTTPLDAALVDFLADRRVLLVLDGCERYLDEVVDLVLRLRPQCPGLKVLATSRRQLGISGEAVVRVPALTTPRPGA